MGDATTEALDIEVRTLAGESWSVVLRPGARTADLRSSLVDRSTLEHWSTGKLYAEGRVLEDDSEPLPVPEDGRQLVVHVAPTVVLDSLDPLDRAILLDDDYVAPQSPSLLPLPQPSAAPLPQEQSPTRRCVSVAILLICISILVGAVSGTLLARRSQRQHEAATVKMVVAHEEDARGHPQGSMRLAEASHANVSLANKRLTTALGLGGLPRLRGLAWSQSVGNEEAALAAFFGGGAPAPPPAGEAETSTGTSFPWSYSPPPPLPPPPLPVVTRPQWQVMVLPLLTSLLALAQPVGRRLFLVLMALARRVLPSERCGVVRRFLTKRGLAFGAEAEELCTKRM